MVALVTCALPVNPARGDSEAPYLAGDGLIAAFSGATLIGSNWAEYYAPDGALVGKVRYLGILREFTGRWIVRQDQVCFEYERSVYNTCSRFRLVGDRMLHFGADGKPKVDGESKRLPGDRLEEFR
jgi:hypothetical protein